MLAGFGKGVFVLGEADHALTLPVSFIVQTEGFFNGEDACRSDDLLLYQPKFRCRLVKLHVDYALMEVHGICWVVTGSHHH